MIPKETLDSIKKNGIVLKNPVTTPVGEGFTSVNVALRKNSIFYANERPVMSYLGTEAQFAYELARKKNEKKLLQFTRLTY